MRTDYDLPWYQDYVGVINIQNKNFYFVGSIDELIKKILSIRHSDKLMVTSCSKNVSYTFECLYPNINKYGKNVKKPASMDGFKEWCRCNGRKYSDGSAVLKYLKGALR